MTLQTAITKETKKLIKQAERNGLYENFGRKEVRTLEDKFIDISDYSSNMNNNRKLLENFSEWCMTYNCGN